MDTYFSNIAREVLSKAHSELIHAQDYLTQAKAPGHLQASIKRQISSLRHLQDEINRIEQREIEDQVRNEAD